MAEQVENQELEELKEYAREIGVDFRDNIGLIKLQEKVAAREDEIAAKKKAEKEAKAKADGKKVKVVISSRDGDDAPDEQFFGCGSMKDGSLEHILIKFDEEIEISERMYEHIKGIEMHEWKYKTVMDKDGIPQKERYKKSKSRFIVSKV